MNLRLASFAAATLLAAVASAATPVGTWNGKILVKMPPIPANAPAAQKEMVAKMMGQLKSGKLVITFKADKTYSAKSVGLPGNQPPSGGTWTQTGATVTTQAKRPGAQPQKLEMSKDGKTMTATLPQGQGKVVFTKA